MSHIVNLLLKVNGLQEAKNNTGDGWLLIRILSAEPVLVPNFITTFVFGSVATPILYTFLCSFKQKRHPYRMPFCMKKVSLLFNIWQF